MKKLLLLVLIVSAYLTAGLVDDLTIITYVPCGDVPLVPRICEQCRQILLIDNGLPEPEGIHGYEKIIHFAEKVYEPWAMKQVIDSVNTPYFFLHYSTNEIIRPVDMNGIIKTMQANETIKHVRLNHRNNVSGKFRDQRLEVCVFENSSIELLRVFDWVDGDHFSQTQHYKNFILPKIKWPWRIECFLSEAMQNRLRRDPVAHDQYGTYMYGSLGEKPYIRRGKMS